MADSPENIALEWASSVEDDLAVEYINQGRDASGDWVNYLGSSVEINNAIMKVKILGADYTVYMEEGRAPNKKQDHASISRIAGFLANDENGPIYKWCEERNIATEYAYAIAYNVAKEGYEGKPLVSEVVTQKRVKELIDSLGNFVIDDLSKGIVKIFRS